MQKKLAKSSFNQALFFLSTRRRDFIGCPLLKKKRISIKVLKY